MMRLALELAQAVFYRKVALLTLNSKLLLMAVPSVCHWLRNIVGRFG